MSDLLYWHFSTVALACMIVIMIQYLILHVFEHDTALVLSLSSSLFSTTIIFGNRLTLVRQG